MSTLNATRRPTFGRSLSFVSIAWLAAMALSGCAEGEPVSTASLATAKARWAGAGVRDYDLEWTSSGLRNTKFAVVVRDGEVKTVESFAPDGRKVVLKPAEPRYYGVDGLFLTIEEELAQLDQATPFGQPKGSKAVLRFTPDPKYGYPLHYRRDVMGAPTALAIDVVRFNPNPPKGGAPSPP